jgi:3-oxoacyl-[acyl-carrier-protein] synthase III
MAHERGDLVPGAKILLLAFGLGFSCGAVALEVA